MRQTAKQFVRDQLASGPRLREDVRRAAEEAGWAFATVQTAKWKLGAVSDRKAGTWALPHDPPTRNQLRYIDALARDTGHLGLPEPRTWTEAGEQIDLLRERPTLRQLEFIGALQSTLSAASRPIAELVALVHTRADAARIIDLLIGLRDEVRERDREARTDELQASGDVWADFYAAGLPPEEQVPLDADGLPVKEAP